MTTSNIIILSVSLAISSFCIMHTVKAVLKDAREQKRREDIEKTKEALNDAVKTGNMARIVLLKRRLQELVEV